MFDVLIKGGMVVDGTGAPGATADVAIADGRIVEIGKLSSPAHRVIEADGLIVTPGWVDAHTHYDAHVLWDPWLEGSFVSGVTTAVFGNCGIGVAPVRSQDREKVIELVEGVEEVPGAALREGLAWNWETFAEYLDAVDAIPRTFDVGALVPHGPLRLWAMGDAVHSEKSASGEALERMCQQLMSALQAGALGFATSRTPIHRTTSGLMTPDFQVEEAELVALAQVVKANGAYIEVVPDGVVGENPEGLRREMAMLERLVDATGVDLHILACQISDDPDYFREQLALMDRLSAKVRATVQFGGRSSGTLLNFLTASPFSNTPTFERIAASLPPERWLAELALPEVRRQILSEENRPYTGGQMMAQAVDRMFELAEDWDYEPDHEQSISRRAQRAGQDVMEFVYDLLLSHGDRPRIWVALINYAHCNLDAIGEALRSPATIMAGSDAGAHTRHVADASMNSFMLTHWVRDRSRGERMGLEEVVHLMTGKAAAAVGLDDRGVLAPGMKADINVIDLDALTIHPPYFANDLPAKAGRIGQDVTGYRATIMTGKVTRENDETTGELPGRLVRRRPGVCMATLSTSTTR